MISYCTGHNVLSHLHKTGNKSNAIYWVTLLIIIATLASLPFLYFDISVKSSGIIRPSSERTDIKPIQTGIIETIFYKEGQLVPQDSTIVQLRNNDFLSKKILSDYELTQHKQYIHDLQQLTAMGYLSNGSIGNLQSPVYKQQITRFIYQKTEQETALKKVKKELWMDSTLSVDKVIAPKEMFDKVVENEKLQAAYHAFKNEQISQWQQDLAKYQLELSQLEAQEQQLLQEKRQYEIKAPVTGIVQGINNRYAGGLVQAGEQLCIISPETDLVAECYVPTQDIGLLKKGSRLSFR